MLLFAGKAVAAPEVFSGQPFAVAKSKAKAEGKLLVVDFTASWCHPCHQMDETTWINAEVQKWLKTNAVAVQIDVDKEPEIKASLSVRAMPTIVVFQSKDTTKEFDRALGYQTPEQLLNWLKGVRKGKTSSSVLVDEAASVLGKGGEKEVVARLKLAQNLLMNGGMAEATDQFVWLWNNIPKECPEIVDVRDLQMASLMARLANQYAPAKERFLQLRSSALKSNNRADWIVLNRVFSDEGVSLKWFDQAKTQPKQSFVREGDQLQDLLIRNNRMADVANFVYKDPVKKLDDTFRLSQKAKGANKDNNAFAKEAVTLYVCCLAAHLDQKAELVARQSLHLQNTSQLRNQLVVTAYNLRLLGPAQLKWLESLEPAGNANFYAERGGLYCEIAQYDRAIKDFDVAIKNGPPNAQLYCSRGIAQYKLNNNQRALDDFNAAGQLAPKNSLVWLNKSVAYYRLKKFSDAYVTASKAIDLDPTNMEGFCNRGEAALRMGKYDAAKADLSKCVASNSKSSLGEAYYYRALTYEKMGLAELAKNDRKAAMTMRFTPPPGE